MVFYASDLFFGNEEVAKKRHFINVFDMNSRIISNWNSLVFKDDVVYILGGVGDMSFLKDLNGEKILVLSSHEEKHYTDFISSVSELRDDEYDREIYSKHVKDSYGISNVCYSHRILKKNYAGRVVRLATKVKLDRDIIPCIIGGINEYQRLFRGGLNSNIFVNGMYPISDIEAEEMFKHLNDIL